MTEHITLEERITQVRSQLQIVRTILDNAERAASARAEVLKTTLKALYTEQLQAVYSASGVCVGDRRKLSDALAAEILVQGGGWWGAEKLARFAEFTVDAVHIGDTAYWETCGLLCFVVLKGDGDTFNARLETVMACEKVGGE